MSKPIVAVDIPLSPAITKLIQPFGEIRQWQEGTAVGAASQALYTYGHTQVDNSLLTGLEQLKVVSNFGVGVDHIDIGAAHRRGVAVGNTPGAVDGATADMTMALVLAAARNLVVGDRFARSAEFTHYDPSLLIGAEVYGSTLGIVGMGAIGRQVAKRARGFDLRVLYHNRNRDRASEEALGVEYTPLSELLARSHFVTLNVPMTPATRHLIGEAELRAMRDDAILINAARGGVVDHDALYRALTEGWIRAAGLDVTEPEPLPRDHPLLQLDNLTLMPHLGSAADRSRQKMAMMSVENLRAGLEGHVLPFAAAAQA